MPPGIVYTRSWVNQEQGEEWVRYECTWQGPANGVYYGRLYDMSGLTSGTWVITIQIEGAAPFKETVFVDGENVAWSPVGLKPCTDW